MISRSTPIHQPTPPSSRSLPESPRRSFQPALECLPAGRDLVRGQCRNGQWTYSYRNTATKRGGDNSNTQLASIALAVARARRVAVPDETFARLDAFLVGSQNSDGGFGYSYNQRCDSYASMTAGGSWPRQVPPGPLLNAV